MARDELAWLALSRLPEVGGARCRQLIARFGSVRAALEAPARDWEEVVGAGVARRARAVSVDWQWAEKQWRELQRLGGRLFTLEDEDYPELLRQISSPPAVLFVLGEADFTQPAVALVGTRQASEYGQAMAWHLAAELARQGLWVISGMASGIDTAAHQGALEAGGRTLAVLGCGPDVIYPRANAQLHQRIREEGAVVAEYPLGYPPDAGTFPRRNRLISGLSLGTVVVEAPAQSGALITAAFALDQNREVFAVPGEVRGGRNAGCHRLIKEGAKLVEGVADILDELGPRFAQRAQLALEFSPPAATAAQPELSPAEKAVFALLTDEPLHIDALAAQSKLPVAELLRVLLDLELVGAVVQVPGKRFLRQA
ncbi:MAG: DNA-protecting protein DprA [Candidatus Latescibacteria bacterium]|nr:DNA-protecting protein DprA [Candidatus Latescibacterota bacterium]